MSSEHEIQFGTLTEEDLVNIRMIKQSDIKRCRFFILVPEHYREDGSCKCDDADHRKMMIREWGYKEADFKNILVR
jgi:hypothetical protein